MASGISQDTAAVMSLALEAMLYGFSVLLFIGTFWVLITKGHIRDINRPIAFAAILLFLLSTAHMIVDIIRVEDGLVKYRDTFRGGPAAFFADVAQVTYVTKDLIFILQTLLGDAVLIYRCHVMWQSLWVVIFPSMLWCSSAVTGFWGIYRASQATSKSGSIFAQTTAQWVTAFFALSVSTNLVGSGLLGYRIWVFERAILNFRSTRGPTILRVLVDSAALYSAAFLATLVCFTLKNNGEVVLLCLLPPLVSISFYMVLIRVATRGKNSSRMSTSRGGTINQTERGTLPRYPMPLQVHISQFSQNDHSSEYSIRDHVRSPRGKEEFVKGASGGEQ